MRLDLAPRQDYERVINQGFEAMDFTPTAKPTCLAHGECHACFDHPVAPVAVHA